MFDCFGVEAVCRIYFVLQLVFPMVYFVVGAFFVTFVNYKTNKAMLILTLKSVAKLKLLLLNI